MSTRRSLPILGGMILVVALSLGANDSQAQKRGGPRGHWNQTAMTGAAEDAAQLPPRMTILSEASSFLDTAQMTKLVELMASHRDELRGPDRRDRQERGHARGREHRGDRHARSGQCGTRGQGNFGAPIDELSTALDLSDEQIAKLETMRNGRREGRQEQRDAWRDQRRDQRLEFLSSVLKLDDSQTAKVKQAMDASATKAAELREGFRAHWQSAGERPDDEARQAQHKAVQSVLQEGRDAVRKVLTAEQQELFDALAKLSPRDGDRDPRPGRGPRGAGRRG